LARRWRSQKRACPHDAVTGPLCKSKALRVGMQREWLGQEGLSYPSKLEVFAVFGSDGVIVPGF